MATDKPQAKARTLLDEELIELKQVTHRLPRRPNGRRVHIATIYRWVNGGVQGHRLEAMKIGGTTYTSLEAMERFVSSKNTNGLASSGEGQSLSARSQRKAAAKQARDLLGLNQESRDK